MTEETGGVELPPPRSCDGGKRSLFARAFPLFLLLAIAAACAQGLHRTALWKSAEPRVMAISLDQQSEGLVRSLTFAGMSFLEQPPLYYDLTALAFRVAGGPSILAARVVVVLLGLVWVASLMLLARRAAGDRAALLAGALLVVSGAFLALVRRFSVDICLTAMLSVALLGSYRAMITDSERVAGPWWWTALAAAGLAALSKGLFGTFLFVVPTLAYAALARDGRVLRALFRPATLALLALPHVLWGLVLYRDGGSTFVFEHFVNNTIGRVLHRRFLVEGVGQLEYSDVGVPYPWYYCLEAIWRNTLPGLLMVPFAVAAWWRRGGFRARDEASRLLVLLSSWGLVPPLILSFSVYKGRGHLGVCFSALILIGAIELARRLPDLASAPVPRLARASISLTLALAPLLIITGFLGVPASMAQVRAVFAAGGAALLIGLFAAIRSHQPVVAVWSLLAVLVMGVVADFSPGGVHHSDETDTLDPVATWVAEQVGDRPVAVYYAPGRRKHDPIGASDEQVVGALTYALGRPPRRLLTRGEVAAFLVDETPGYVLARQEKSHRKGWPDGEPGVGWVAVGGNRFEAFLLVANRAAAAKQPGPSTSPPDVPSR